jgi:hypothetical protein
MNQVHTPQPCFLTTHFNIISSTHRFSERSFTLRLFVQNFVSISHVSHACCMPRPSQILPNLRSYSVTELCNNIITKLWFFVCVDAIRVATLGRNKTTPHLPPPSHLAKFRSRITTANLRSCAIVPYRLPLLRLVCPLSCPFELYDKQWHVTTLYASLASPHIHCYPRVTEVGVR